MAFTYPVHKQIIVVIRRQGFDLKILSAGTHGIIVTTQSVVTAFFGMIFLKEHYSIVNCTLALLSLVGVVLVIGPNVNELKEHGSSTPTNHTDFVRGYLLAVAGCFSAVILKSLFTVYSRKVIKDNIDYELTVLYPSLASIVMTPMVMLIFQEEVIIAQLPTKGWLIVLSGAFASFLGSLFTSLVLKYEHAGIVCFLISTELVWAYGYDICIAHDTPNKYSIVGIVITVVFTSLFMLNRIFSIEKRLQGWCKSRTGIGSNENDKYQLLN